MAIELKVPQIGESITEVVIGAWLKQPGDAVARDEALVELESDKATVELPAPEAGTLGEIRKQQGDTAAVGEVIATLEKNGGAKAKSPAKKHEKRAEVKSKEAPAKAEKREAKPPAAPKEEPPAAPKPPPPASADGREEETIPMTPLRRRVAERLVAAQQTAALLSTFNEVDMSAIVALRKAHGEAFLQRTGVKLGFMSFFVKACVDALGRFPALNAEIAGESIVYRNYFDVGIAIAGGKGLVVPVIKSAERLSFAEIEATIADFAERARQNKLKLEELYGGTFSITNGGVFGSLLSTPIVNPPESGILGMHAIQDRPVARDGDVVIRPMMYVALTYDHRIVDGREAVQFLVRIKEVIEDPARMLLEV